LFDSTGIPSNPNQPGGYSVRMENTLPLVTQAPAIQPLPMRPGVIAQVSAYFTRYWGKNNGNQPRVVIHLDVPVSIFNTKQDTLQRFSIVLS